MAYRWGFDTAQVVTSELWSKIATAVGRGPWFIGRYLGTGGGAATPLTAEEAAYIQGQGAAILPVYNDSPINGGTPGTYALGQQDAAAAIAQAQALGVPTNTYLVCDVEYSAQVTGVWIQGWADAMRASDYAGAGILYCAPQAPTWQQAWSDAVSSGNPNVRRLFLWSAQPAQMGASAADLPAWAPVEPQGALTVLWQWSDGCQEGNIDLDLCDDSILQTNPIYGNLWLPVGGVAPKAPFNLMAAQTALAEALTAQQALAAALGKLQAALGS